VNFTLPLEDDLTVTLHEHRHMEEIYALIDANRAHLDTWFEWPAETRRPEDLRGFVDGSLAMFARGEGFHGGLRCSGRLVGGLSLHNVYRAEHRAEVGYWLAAAEQGKGIVTRAVRGLLDHLFTIEGFRRVEIRAISGNAASRAVAERLGFTYEGTFRHIAYLRGEAVDHAVYSLLVDEWRTRRHAEEETP